MPRKMARQTLERHAGAAMPEVALISGRDF
jgi:hypothetical protein